MITQRVLNKKHDDLILHYNGKAFLKTMYEVWRKKMLAAKKKLLFKLRLKKRMEAGKKIKFKHRHLNVAEIIPKDYLKQKKYKQLKAISRLSLLLIKKRNIF